MREFIARIQSVMRENERETGLSVRPAPKDRKHIFGVIVYGDVGFTPYPLILKSEGKIVWQWFNQLNEMGLLRVITYRKEAVSIDKQ